MDTFQSFFTRVRRSIPVLSPFDYAATLALVAVYAIGTSIDDGPKTSMDFYRAASTVIPTLLITVAVQGRVFELSRKATFRLRYRTVMFAVVVFGGETGTLMTLARQRTNWAAHLYVYLAVVALGFALLYVVLAGMGESKPSRKNATDDETESRGRGGEAARE